jgi:hypothetical protein
MSAADKEVAMKLTLQVAAFVASMAVLYVVAGWAAGMTEHRRSSEQIIDSIEQRQQKIETDLEVQKEREKLDRVCDHLILHCVELDVPIEACNLPVECR